MGRKYRVVKKGYQKGGTFLLRPRSVPLNFPFEKIPPVLPSRLGPSAYDMYGLPLILGRRTTTYAPPRLLVPRPLTPPSIEGPPIYSWAPTLHPEIGRICYLTKMHRRRCHSFCSFLLLEKAWAKDPEKRPTLLLFKSTKDFYYQAPRGPFLKTDLETPYPLGTGLERVGREGTLQMLKVTNLKKLEEEKMPYHLDFLLARKGNSDRCFILVLPPATFKMEEFIAHRTVAETAKKEIPCDRVTRFYLEDLRRVFARDPSGPVSCVDVEKEKRWIKAQTANYLRAIFKYGTLASQIEILMKTPWTVTEKNIEEGDFKGTKQLVLS